VLCWCTHEGTLNRNNPKCKWRNPKTTITHDCIERSPLLSSPLFDFQLSAAPVALRVSTPCVALALLPGIYFVPCRLTHADSIAPKCRYSKSASSSRKRNYKVQRHQDDCVKKCWCTDWKTGTEMQTFGAGPVCTREYAPLTQSM
jgi:hypothetical protein